MFFFYSFYSIFYNYFLTLIHLYYFHLTISDNPLSINRNVDKIYILPCLIIKNVIGLIIFF